MTTPEIATAFSLGARNGPQRSNVSSNPRDRFSSMSEQLLRIPSCLTSSFSRLTEKKTDFVLQNTFHWVKSITIKTRKGEEISAGHFKPINSKRFVNDCHEYVFHLTASGAVPLQRREAGVEYADKSNIARWKHTDGSDKRCRGNTWFIPYDTIKSRDNDRPHPASFPVDPR